MYICLYNSKGTGGPSNTLLGIKGITQWADRILFTVKIDDLGSIDDFENTYDVDKTSRALKQIKYLSQDAHLPIISLYCLKTKEIYKRQDKRPTPMGLDHSSLQSYNDSIHFLYKDEYYETTPSLEVIIAKNILGYQYTARLATSKGKIFSFED